MINKLINNLSGSDTQKAIAWDFSGILANDIIRQLSPDLNPPESYMSQRSITISLNEKPSSLASEIIKLAHKACARQKDTKSLMLLNCTIDCCKVFFSLQLSRCCFLLACIWNFHDYEKAKRHEQKSNGESHNQSCCVAL